MRIWVYPNYCGTDGTHILSTGEHVYPAQDGCNEIIPDPPKRIYYQCEVCGQRVWGGLATQIKEGQPFPPGYNSSICHTVPVPEPAGTLFLIAGVLLLAWLAERRVRCAGRR